MQYIKDKLSGTSSPPSNSKDNKDKWVLLVLSAKHQNWAELFKGVKIHGKEIRVEESTWRDINLASYSNYGPKQESACFVDFRDPQKNSMVTVKPDFLLVRSLHKGALPDQDFTNILYGFKYAGVPSVNSLQSVYSFQERPWVFGELLEIRNRLGADKFPLIEQTYYPNHREMIIGPQFPAVVKVGHAHAGYGKMKVHDHHDFADFASIIALNKNYVTAEHFYEGEYDIRIQKIGNHYRAFKRMAMGSNWKTNTGTSVVEPIELKPEYKLWADEASKMFGGMDILAVDAIHTTDGKEYILEVNDSSIGLMPELEAEDMGFMRDLVVQRMTEQLKK